MGSRCGGVGGWMYKDSGRVKKHVKEARSYFTHLIKGDDTVLQLLPDMCESSKNSLMECSRNRIWLEKNVVWTILNAYGIQEDVATHSLGQDCDSSDERGSCERVRKVVRVNLFLVGLGIDEERLWFRQHLPNEMAHYDTDG
uniref:Glycine--tRNA ligase, mitochondrial 1-like n=1 Tax=Tanacetum cinerariifolium TaxID=118510 RepID=A0A6L2NKN8_TANCI|nr:glycine--tRNA ligase, mitochondrial 1-like [Tanacetum cinerariifolium]